MLTDTMMVASPGLEIEVEEQLLYYKSITDQVKDMTVDTIKYPYVTSSNPIVKSPLTDLGASPDKVKGVYGTVKGILHTSARRTIPHRTQYLTKPDSIGYHLCHVGVEYGTTTGGWMYRRCSTPSSSPDLPQSISPSSMHNHRSG